MYKKVFKRVIDTVIGLLVLALLWPVILIAALAIVLEDPGPVLFRQERLGKDGQVFKMLKLRTMKVNSEHTGSGVYSGKGDPRVTKVGRVLRATSIDELVQAVHLVSGKSVPARRLPTTPGPLRNTPPSSAICLTCAPALPAGRRSMGAKAWSGTRG